MEVVLCYSLEFIDVGFVKVGSFEALSQGVLEMSVGEGIQDGRLLSDKGKMDGVFGFVGPMTKVSILYAAILRGYKLMPLSIIYDKVRHSSGRVGNMQLQTHQSPMTCASHKLPPRLCFGILRRESMSISR